MISQDVITWSFYRLADGIFDGRSFSALEPSMLSANTPSGYGARVGVTDWQSQRVNIATGELVAYQPPVPGDDHEWNVETKRWQMNPAAIQREAVQERIREVERRQTPRMLREAALGDAEAVARLKAFDQEIAALRVELQRPERS